MDPFIDMFEEVTFQKPLSIDVFEVAKDPKTELTLLVLKPSILSSEAQLTAR